MLHGGSSRDNYLLILLEHRAISTKHRYGFETVEVNLCS